MGLEHVTVFTVGHSSMGLDGLLGLLHLHGIEVLADVRSAPYSKFVPAFNREVLVAVLPQHGIRYLFLGSRLGGRPDGGTDEIPGKADYAEMGEKEEFRAGIDALVAEAGEKRVCVLCSEEDPGRCHRGLLIGRVLAGLGVGVVHIRGDGSLETQVQMSLRMAKGQLSLFPS